MGDVLNPNPPQWKHKQQLEEVSEDHVVQLTNSLMLVLCDGVETTTVQLAALRLVQKAVISNYQLCMGEAATKELLRQAAELAQHYTRMRPDGTEEEA